MAISRPTTMPIPFADGGGKNTIPTAASTTPGAASLTEGFPPVTRTPLVAGGVPPSGLDMNGILNLLSQHVLFVEGGGQYRFDAALVSAQGGYPIGTVLQSDDGRTQYLNIVANNTTNFNTTPASIGVSWIPYSTGRLINIQYLTVSGVPTYNPGTRFITGEAIGAGGAGGGSTATNSSQISFGSGGGAGARTQFMLTSGFVGQMVNIGIGGVPAASANGGNGGATSLGSLVTASGGMGGGVFGPVAPPLTAGRANTTTGSGGLMTFPGANGTEGFMTGLTFGFSGAGADGNYGRGGGKLNGSGAGVNTGGYGAGGGGALSTASSAAAAGGFGGNGLFILYEWA